MKVAVMGAGAVGCYYGGMLRRAGHEVVLIARPQHVAAIEQHGLRLQTRSFDQFVPLSASTQPQAVAGAELVLFSVKSNDTETAGRQIAPHLAPQALVVTLQNGIDNAERLRGAVVNEVRAAVVYVAAGMAGAGHVRHHGRGELLIESSPRSAQLAQLLADAGVPTEIRADVRGALWTKLILNCAYNALSAIAQVPYGQLVQVDGVSAVLRDLVDECLAVARAEGVTPDGDVDAALRKIAQTMPQQYSSTAQDLARGQRSEIEHLNGLIVRKAREHSLTAPVNQAMLTLVKIIEAKQAAQ